MILSGRSTLTGTDRSGSGDDLPVTRDNIQQLKERLEQSIHKLNDLKSLSNQIEITVTPEGLRIELLETKDGSFFKTGSADLNANGRELLTVLAQQLGTVPNRISIEGHTDSRPYAGAANDGNWELSSDRANAARRLMQRTGLRVTQVLAGPRLCRPAPAGSRKSSRSIQPQNFAHRAVSRCAANAAINHNSGTNRGSLFASTSGCNRRCSQSSACEEFQQFSVPAPREDTRPLAS